MNLKELEEAERALLAYEETLRHEPEDLDEQDIFERGWHTMPSVRDRVFRAWPQSREVDLYEVRFGSAGTIQGVKVA